MLMFTFDRFAVQVAAMTEKKTATKLTAKTDSGTETPDPKRCIICQKSTPEATTGTENGRKRVHQAASIREDVVSKRLKVIGQEDFVYHMSNQCYKTYTMKSVLDRITKGKSAKSQDVDNTTRSKRAVRRSSSMPRPEPSPECKIYKQTCVICGNVKHQGNYEKYRISESQRAKKFLEATVFMQDEVFTRTCDLQDIHAAFGADLYCHKQCVNRYLLQYERACSDRSDENQTASCMQKAWTSAIADIETGLANGNAYELSYVRDAMRQHGSDSVTNREVIVLLTNHFGDQICYSQPKQLNKSRLFFSRSVTAESMVETIRSTDPIKQCAELIRQSLLDTDFELNDRFCDASDLKTSWKNVIIPETLLKFFEALYRFDATKPIRPTSEDEHDEQTTGLGLSENRSRQMQGLFQIMYHDLHQGRKRTPFHIMNSQAIYDACKSKSLITSFSRFGLCSSYDELMRHQNDIASFTVAHSNETVPFPSHFDKGMFTMGAFDNFDHDEANLSGMGGSHDTVTVLFQDDGDSLASKPKRSETNIQHGAKAFNVVLKCQEMKQFFKPSKKPDLPEEYTVPTSHSVNHDLLKDVRSKEVAWLLGRMDLCEADPHSLNTRPQNQTMPIWSAANSVLSVEDVPLKRVGFLPVLPYPVTQYDTVYTAMKNLLGVLEYLDQPKLSVTCDEGVYRIAREIQLIRPEEFDNIVLCLGSFHMAKVALGCLGKYLKGSGAENILIESSVFGPKMSWIQC